MIQNAKDTKIVKFPLLSLSHSVSLSTYNQSFQFLTNLPEVLCMRVYLDIHIYIIYTPSFK